MSQQPLTAIFIGPTKPGEIVIQAEIGYPGIDIGPAYVIDNCFGEVDQTIYENEEDRDREVTRYDDAVTRLQGLMQSMAEKAENIDVEINDIYATKIDTEIMMVDMLFADSPVVRDQILEKGITAEKAIYDFLQPNIERAEQGIKKEENAAKEQARPINKNAMLNPTKVLGYSRFFQTALIKFSRGHDLHSLENIPDKPHGKSPIPITDNVQVGELVHLKSEDGHSTKVHSIVRSQGTSGDHTEIIANGLRIAVANISEEDQIRIQDGETIIVDGTKGIIIVNPAASTLEDYKGKLQIADHENKILGGLSQKDDIPFSLNDEPVEISANIGFAAEMYAVNVNNAAAVRLYRSEVAIDTRQNDSAGTSLKKFVEIYDKIAKSSTKNDKSKPIVMRTPDLVGDKDIDGLSEEKKTAYIKDSIMAMHITAKNNPDAIIEVMFPMINTQEQFEDMKKWVTEAAAEVGIPALQTGAMIETPSAVEHMNALDADFYSVGTNDLIPLVLDYDRYTETDHKYDPTHPDVLEALLKISQGAYQQNKSVSICGDMASDPRCFAILMGSGFRSLSCGVGNVPMQKELVRRVDTRATETLVENLMNESDVEKRNAILDGFNEKYLGLCPNRTIELDWETRSASASTLNLETE